MSDTLARIVAYKQEHVAAMKALHPLSAIEAAARTQSAPRGTEP